MKSFLFKFKLEIAGALIGSIVGYCYWNFIGCASGTCAITSNPLNSTLYGSIMGGLVCSIFNNSKK